MEWDEQMTEYVDNLRHEIEELRAAIVALTTWQAQTTATLAEIVRQLAEKQPQE